jgi:hypothetical protein
LLKRVDQSANKQYVLTFLTDVDTLGSKQVNSCRLIYKNQQRSVGEKQEIIFRLSYPVLKSGSALIHPSIHPPNLIIFLSDLTDVCPLLTKQYIQVGLQKQYMKLQFLDCLLPHTWYSKEFLVIRPMGSSSN